MPTYLELMKNGALTDIVSAGAIVRECFCGPCFGAGDTPANGELSVRHATRNFPNREGSKPGEGQMAGVALMDARSIAATAINGGRLTAATELDVTYSKPKYFFDKSVYDKRVYNGYGKAEPAYALKMGPNIKDWPAQPALSQDLMLQVVSYITDPVTTTDELIPSGETSSYRSNPLRLAEFTLSRKDPAYVGRAKAIHSAELAREAGEKLPEAVEAAYAALQNVGILCDPQNTVIASTIYANKPGDGSAREQAASCQRVLGGGANLAREYATKRYRSNCINWGLVPLLVEDERVFGLDDFIFVPDIRGAIEQEKEKFSAYYIKRDGSVKEFPVSIGKLTPDERQIILDGCLINYYRNH
jgi:aconitate hydratase